MLLLMFFGFFSVRLLWLFAEIDEKIVKLFILSCLHLNSNDKTVQIAYMHIGTISNIHIPEHRKIEIKLEELVSIKNAPTDEPFCEVKIVQSHQCFYALKIIHKKQIPEQSFQEEYCRIENEINALYALEHPNVIKLHYHKETEEDILLLMEYGGVRIWSTLNKKQLSEQEVRDLTYQMLLGLKQIHDNGYIHRDLSTDNILVTRQNHIKIIDLGFCNQIRGRRTKIGNLFYMAPQITGDDIYNHKADIWSLGILIYEMLHQDLPFCSRREFQEKTYLENRDKIKFNLKSSLSTQAVDFLKRMIVLDPEQRANVDELLKHPFIRPVRDQSQAQSESSFFDRLNETEKIERKTQKNNPYMREKSQKSQEIPVQSQRGIHYTQKDFKRSTNQIFACLHHQKDLLSQLIKTYQDILQKQAINRVRNY